jgi:protein-tyrosine phosphatase
MRRVAAAHGLKYSGRARQFATADFERFDWIIAMDPNNQNDLHRLTANPQQQAKIRLMRAFDPNSGPGASVPDPYYGGDAGFCQVVELIEDSCDGLLRSFS